MIMKGRNPLGLVLAVVLVLAYTTHLESASLKVSPGRFTIRDIEPGRKYDVYRETGARLTIYNDGDTVRTWTLSLHRPSERGRWELGYSEIPDPEWCWFEEDEIAVAPHGEAHAHLFLEIPDEELYFNQHWVATATVGGKAGIGPIALEVDVRILLETKPKTGMAASPYGPLGIEPSRVRLDNVLPGRAEKARIVIHNNDDATHEYDIVSLFSDAEIMRPTYLANPFEALPDPTWIAHAKKIVIDAGDSSTLDLDIRIPDAEDNYDMKLEEVLLIRPDERIPGFVRIQMQTKARPEE